MKIIATLFVVTAILTYSCTSELDKNAYPNLIADLQNSIEVEREIDTNYFLSIHDMVAICENSVCNESDEYLLSLVEKKIKQQKSQFKRVVKKIYKNDELQYQYLKSDSIGGIVKGNHYIDVALYYQQISKPEKLKIFKFEMIVVNGKYRYIDDINKTSEKSWLNHVKSKQIEIGLIEE